MWRRTALLTTRLTICILLLLWDYVKHYVVGVDVSVADANLFTREVLYHVKQLHKYVFALLLIEFGHLRLLETLTVSLVVEVPAILSLLQHLGQALSLHHVHDEVHCALHLVVERVVHLHDVVVADAPQELVLLVSDLYELYVVCADNFDGQALTKRLLSARARTLGTWRG